jgi:uncharacterized protein YggE
MNKRIWTILAMAAVLLTLTNCGQANAQPNRETEAAALQGGGVGGGAGSFNGQYVEGLVAVGSGKASAEPEIAVISLGVDLRGSEPAAMVDEAALKIDAIAAAVEGLGVAGDDVRTTGYNLWVENLYDHERGLPTGEVVYHVSHYVEVTLRDLDKVGELMADVVEAGANTISGVSFTVAEPEALVEQARQAALADAAAKAGRMAEGLDIALGKPVSVMETTGGPYPVLGLGGGGGEMMAAPSVSPGTFTVSVGVQIVYEIR